MNDDCQICQHPFAWHGDRAVCPCDGGWANMDAGGMVRFRRRGEPVSICACPGWAEPQTNPV